SKENEAQPPPAGSGSIKPVGGNRTAEEKAAGLRRAPIVSDARGPTRKQGGNAHDRRRRPAAPVVSRPHPPPVEHPARRQSRLAVRRVRIVCAVLDGRSGHALLA